MVNNEMFYPEVRRYSERTVAAQPSACGVAGTGSARTGVKAVCVREEIVGGIGMAERHTGRGAVRRA